MSDDLVKRLRNPKGDSGSDFNATYWVGLITEAADRIEALEKALRNAMSNFLSLADAASVEDELDNFAIDIRANALEGAKDIRLLLMEIAHAER